MDSVARATNQHQEVRQGGSSMRQQLCMQTDSQTARSDLAHTVPQVLEDAVKKPFRVAYQGVPGAYSEMAACKACPDAEPVPCEQFEVAFQVSRAMKPTPSCSRADDLARCSAQLKHMRKPGLRLSAAAPQNSSSWHLSLMLKSSASRTDICCAV